MSVKERKSSSRQARDPSADFAKETLVTLAYRVLLGREVEPRMLSERARALQSDVDFEEMFFEIASSEEAKLNGIKVTEDTKIPTNLVQLMYRTVLGREAEPDALAERVGTLNNGVSFAEMFLEIAASPEAKDRDIDTPLSSLLDKNRGHNKISASDMIRLVYQIALGREVEPDVLTERVSALNNGVPFAQMFVEIATSAEAKDKIGHSRVGGSLSDGDFLTHVGPLLYGRGLNPREVVAWQNILRESAAERVLFVNRMIDEHIGSLVRPEGQVTPERDPTWVGIMGTKQILTPEIWIKRGNELDLSRLEGVPTAKDDHKFHHTGIFTASIITSLYKGGSYINKFLENITSQSLFDRTELIIVDAESPDREWEVIEKYQGKFSNIIYKRINYRIGIYEAWNLASEMARGTFLTNANLDDLRKYNSIELQSNLLIAEPEIDVVYQDFYYSFDPKLNFEQVEAYGFKSELPIITPHNLLMYNSPHNAPMWRKALHEKLGPFDARYQSAGDYEFWLRCLLDGKKFRKINTPHIVYYQNPKGVSTRPDTQGAEEAHSILSRYSRALISPTLRQSRRDFYANIGILADSENLDWRSYYDVAQDELCRLGQKRFLSETKSI